jgi:hypothetical protein
MLWMVYASLSATPLTSDTLAFYFNKQGIHEFSLLGCSAV